MADNSNIDPLIIVGAGVGSLDEGVAGDDHVRRLAVARGDVESRDVGGDAVVAEVPAEARGADVEPRRQRVRLRVLLVDHHLVAVDLVLPRARAIEDGAGPARALPGHEELVVVEELAPRVVH